MDLALDPVSPWPVLLVLCVAIVTARLLERFWGVIAPVGRYRSIEGLRGYLALSVFLHHACIWYFYQRDHVWAVPPSRLYTQLGQVGVAFFFMITGFLFFSKLLDHRDRGIPIDWAALFRSRARRLVPLYLFAMLLMALCVAQVSGWQLQDHLLTLIRHGLSWVFFTAWGAPNLNGVSHTFTIVAGVTWSLPYEWLFYASLPVLGGMVGLRSSRKWTAMGALALLLLLARQPVLIHVTSFLGGILAAWAARHPKLQMFASSHLASWLMILLLGMEVMMFDTAYGAIQSIMLTAVFVLIASGNTLFGSLTTNVSYILGQMAYSIYMLHGLCLFMVFNTINGYVAPSHLSGHDHWLTIMMIVPLLVVFSFVSFVFWEKPFMNKNHQRWSE